MKKIIQLILLLISFFMFKEVSAQIADPIHWSYHANKISDCEYELVVQAKLDDGWHLYGQKPYGDDGPYPTSFHYTPSPNYELIGITSEETLIKKFEPVFNIELNYFEHEAFFKQRVKIKSDTLIQIKGDFEFMVCNEVTCMPPSTVPFSFTIQGSSSCSKIWFNLMFFVLFLLLSISFLGGFEIRLLTRMMNRFNAVKIILGFLSLACAIKFISNVDLLMQAGIITREVFISFWVVIFVLMGIYLMGGIKFSNDHERKHVSVQRLFFAILAFAFTSYLIPGLWGAPLKLVNNFPPPYSYSESIRRYGNF